MGVPRHFGRATQTWAAEDSAPYSSIPAAGHNPPRGGGARLPRWDATRWDATFWFCPGERRRDTYTHTHTAVIRLVGVLGLPWVW